MMHPLFDITIWKILLAGLNFFFQLIVIPMFGGPENYHQALGLAGVMGQGGYLLIQLIFVTFSMFDLTLPFIALVISMPLIIIKFAIDLYRFILSLIPFAR